MLSILPLALAATVSAQTIPALPPLKPTTLAPYCPVNVVRDYTLGVTYYAILELDPNCPPGGLARVRKSSSINLGARYQPIKPLKGAWELNAYTTTVPPWEHWTLLSWRWQYWDGGAWRDAVTQ